MIFIFKVFEAAQKGFNAVGVELNFWLVLYSKLKAIRLSSSASFYRQNIWKVPLNNYETVVIFGVESMVRGLFILLNNYGNAKVERVLIRDFTTFNVYEMMMMMMFMIFLDERLGN